MVTGNLKIIIMRGCSRLKYKILEWNRMQEYIQHAIHLAMIWKFFNNIFHSIKFYASKVDTYIDMQIA
jgi:hypothetical protein